MFPDGLPAFVGATLALLAGAIPAPVAQRLKPSAPGGQWAQKWVRRQIVGPPQAVGGRSLPAEISCQVTED